MHAVERMWLRGISLEEIKKAVTQGQRKIQKRSNLIESLYSYYSIVYDERVYKEHNLRKIYPVTVKLW